MSLTDPIRLEHLEKRGTWILVQGRETFYDEQRGMIEFPSPAEAVEWAVANIGREPEGFERAPFVQGGLWDGEGRERR